MKTRLPLVVTARLARSDLEPFDLLRWKHFPPDRNMLPAHLTMFHRLPGEYLAQITAALSRTAREQNQLSADVAGIRHLGAGVAFTIASLDLEALRRDLKATFLTWLGPQDMQVWQPHITIQNKVPKTTADRLHGEMLASFRPHQIEITGLDLWRYLGGPWRQEMTFDFMGQAKQAGMSISENRT